MVHNMTTVVPLTISRDYGYVLLIAASASFLNLWHALRPTKFRTAIKLPYPHMFATPQNRSPETKSSISSPLGTNLPSDDFGGLTRSEFIFNCAQRAHMNYGENLPTFFASLLLAGVEYPKTAAAMGAVWLAARIVYAVGYTKPEWGKNGRGRTRGGTEMWWVTQYGLALVAGWSGAKMVLGW